MSRWPTEKKHPFMCNLSRLYVIEAIKWAVKEFNIIRCEFMRPY
jgi:hypothetical protein